MGLFDIFNKKKEDSKKFGSADDAAKFLSFIFLKSALDAIEEIRKIIPDNFIMA
jgi:hypothetical protein